jgi:hypothetical protein
MAQPPIWPSDRVIVGVAYLTRISLARFPAGRKNRTMLQAISNLPAPIVAAIFGFVGVVLTIAIPILLRRKKIHADFRRKIANSFWLGYEISTVSLARFSQAVVRAKQQDKAEQDDVFSTKFVRGVQTHIDIVTSRLKNLNVNDIITSKVLDILRSPLTDQENEVEQFQTVKHLVSADLEIKFGKDARRAFIFALNSGFVLGSVIALGSKLPPESVVELKESARALGLPVRGLTESTTFEEFDTYLRNCGQKLDA